MKIQVSKILDNPYRNFDRNPLIQDRIDQLKESIEETGFWDNVVVRKSVERGYYDLAYGHHRLQAVIECGIKHVDVPVKEISDAVMVKMMADENRMQWGNSPAATNEAIEGAQLILEEAIADSDTLADFRGFAGELAKLSKGWKPSDWSRIKNSGEAGVKMIHDFLGESWATGVIQSSLNVINADRTAEKKAEEARRLEAEAKKAKDESTKQKLEKKAEKAKVATEKAKASPTRDEYEGFRTSEQAEVFTREVRKHTMTPQERGRLAKHVIAHDTSKRSIPTTIEQWAKRNTKIGKAKAKQAKEKAAKIKGVTLEDYVSDFNASVPEIITMLNDIEPYVDLIGDVRVLSMFKKRMEELTSSVNKVGKKLNALQTLRSVN